VQRFAAIAMTVLLALAGAMPPALGSSPSCGSSCAERREGARAAAPRSACCGEHCTCRFRRAPANPTPPLKERPAPAGERERAAPAPLAIATIPLALAAPPPAARPAPGDAAGFSASRAKIRRHLQLSVLRD
jgi:hypothetical protein